jgi:biotin carboxyl carrier protein
LQYDVEIGGRTRRVTVTRTGATFAVAVDGHTRNVDAARIDAQTLSLILDDVWSRDVVVAPDPATGRLTVRVEGVDVALMVNGRGRPGGFDRRAAHAGPHAGRGEGPERAVAPMPGKVLRVLVRPGQEVKSRQPLLVVEAMKMENELRAGRDGIVAEVHALEGQSVDAGALLIVIQ